MSTRQSSSSPGMATHLYAFVVGETAYGDADPEFDDGIESQEGLRLSDIAAQGDRVRYEYDFGDGWLHTLEETDAALAQI